MYYLGVQSYVPLTPVRMLVRPFALLLYDPEVPSSLWARGSLWKEKNG